MNTSLPNEPPTEPAGTRDGWGADDRDEPYRFGRRPTARAPFPFTERQYARLLVFRSHVQDEQGMLCGSDDHVRLFQPRLEPCDA